MPPPIPKLGLKPLSATRPRRTSSLSAAPDDPPALLSRLGKGSYGSVWSARQRSLDGERLVAVKIARRQVMTRTSQTLCRGFCARGGSAFLGERLRGTVPAVPP